MESIGERISKARRYLNINQKELCKKANITEASLSRYENGIREPKANVIVQLANALEVSTDYLLGINDKKDFKKLKIEKSPQDLETIIEETKSNLIQEGLLFCGKPACKEAIDSILKGIKMGMLLAFEEQNKSLNK